MKLQCIVILTSVAISSCKTAGSNSAEKSVRSQNNHRENGFDLANNGKVVECNSESYFYTLNANRTTIKFEAEGESNGPQKITKKVTNGINKVSYTTSEGTLVLSDKKNTWKDDSESQEVECRSKD